MRVCCMRKMKKVICSKDRRIVLGKCAEKTPMIAKVEEHLSWAKLWDQTLDLGGKAVLGLQMISRVMSHHGRGMHPCHLCKEETALGDVTLLEHIITTHYQELHLAHRSFDYSDLLGKISNLELEILHKFKNVFHT